MAILPQRIHAFFLLKNGVPATGLTPSIIIWESGTPAIVVGGIGGSPEVFMVEVGGGWYKYDFTTYDTDLKYTFRVDGQAGGGPNLSGQYSVGTNANFADEIAYETWEETTAAHPDGSPETFGSLLKAIQAGQGAQGSPQLTVQSIVAGVWGELLLGSPQPYPPGSAGGLIKLISETSGLTEQQVADAVWLAVAGDYVAGSPITMGAQLNAATAAAGLTEQQVADAVWLAAADDYLAGSPAGSPVTMGAQLNTTTATTVTTLKYQRNRTRIDTTARTLTIFDDDAITPIRVFDLRDSAGSLSITEITERDPQ